MRPNALLFAAVQAETAIDLRGRAVPFVSAERYAVISCSQVNTCGGQCADIWCDGDEVGECASETRQVIRVAEQCAFCASGDLLLSRNVFQVLSRVERAWIGVRWRCVSCETSSSSIDSGDVELRVIEQATCPGPAAAGSSGVISSVENTPGGAIQDGSASGEDLPFGGVGSPENDTSESFDAEIAVPVASSTYSGSESKSYGGSSSGSLSSSGLAQADTKPWNGQGEKTAPPVPYEPIPTIPSYSPSSPSYASSDGASATSLPAPANAPSSTSSTNGGGSSSSEPPAWPPSSGGYGHSVSLTSSASSIDSDTKYPVGTVVAPADTAQDTRSASPGSSASTTAEMTDKEVSTTASPAPSLGSTDNSLSDGHLSATAAVAKSPFFYAAVLLAIAGLAGVVVGYRAKQKRNHHTELRAIRTTPAYEAHTPGQRLRPQALAT